MLAIASKFRKRRLQSSGIKFIVITLKLETTGYASLFTYLVIYQNQTHNPDVRK